jgi:hypothetical protein
MLPDFSKLFEDGRAVESADYGRVVLRRHAAGELRLPTGRVVACDPAAPETDPYTVGVAPGSHPVVLSVAHFEEDGDQRVAGAMLVVSDGAPVRWELALVAGQDASELEGDEVFGYAVESGFGCLMDAESAARYVDALEEDDSSLEERIADALDATYVDTWSWANVPIDAASGLNLAAFSAGMGDGLYASYFGFDAAGEVVALVTDFALFEHADLG